MASLEILLSTLASFPSAKQSLTSLHWRNIEMGSYIQIFLVALLVTSVVDIGVKGGDTGSFPKIDKDMTEGLSKLQTSERGCLPRRSKCKFGNGECCRGLKCAWPRGSTDYLCCDVRKPRC